MKGRQFMGKAAEAAKNNTSGIIKVTIGIVTIALVLGAIVWAGGRMEERVKTVCNTVAILSEKQQRHEDIIDQMRREAAYQKGVVNTKLEEIEKNVNRTLEIVQQWEISYAEEAQTQN